MQARDQDARNLLDTINRNGEMPAKDLLGLVPRRKNDYRDFFVAANLMHAGYFDFNAGTEKCTNSLGVTSRDTAINFAQIMLPEGESFEINGCSRNSWHDFHVKAFSTAKGFLKLEEIREAETREIRDQNQKHKDYLMAILTGILIVILSSWLFHYFSMERSKVTTPNKQLNQDAPKSGAPVS